MGTRLPNSKWELGRRKRDRRRLSSTLLLLLLVSHSTSITHSWHEVRRGPLGLVRWRQRNGVPPELLVWGGVLVGLKKNILNYYLG